MKLDPLYVALSDQSRASCRKFERERQGNRGRITRLSSKYTVNEKKLSYKIISSDIARNIKCE